MAIDASVYLSNEEAIGQIDRLRIPLPTSSVNAAAAAQSRAASVGAESILTMTADLVARSKADADAKAQFDLTRVQTMQAAADAAAAKTVAVDTSLQNLTVQKERLKQEDAQLIEQRIQLQQESEKGGFITKIVNGFKLDSIEEKRQTRLRNIQDIQEKQKQGQWEVATAIEHEKTIKVIPTIINAQAKYEQTIASTQTADARQTLADFTNAFKTVMGAAENNLGAVATREQNARAIEDQRMQRAEFERRRKQETQMFDSPEVTTMLRLTGQPLTVENKMAAANRLKQLPADIGFEWYAFSVAAEKNQKLTGANLQQLALTMGGSIPQLSMSLTGDRTGLQVLQMSEQAAVQQEFQKIVNPTDAKLRAKYYDRSNNLTAAGRTLAMKEAQAAVSAMTVDQKLQLSGNTIKATPSAYNPNRWNGNQVKNTLLMAKPAEVAANPYLKAVAEDEVVGAILRKPVSNPAVGEGERAIAAVESVMQRYKTSQADAVNTIAKFYELSARNEAAQLNLGAVGLLESRGIDYTPAVISNSTSPSLMNIVRKGLFVPGIVEEYAPTLSGTFDITKPAQLNELIIKSKKITKSGEGK